MVETSVDIAPRRGGGYRGACRARRPTARPAWPCLARLAIGRAMTRPLSRSYDTGRADGNAHLVGSSGGLHAQVEVKRARAVPGGAASQAHVYERVERECECLRCRRRASLAIAQLVHAYSTAHMYIHGRLLHAPVSYRYRRALC